MREKPEFFNIIDEIKKKISVDEFNIWFSDFRLGRITETAIYFNTKGNFIRERIIYQYKSVLDEVIFSLYGKNLNVVVEEKTYDENESIKANISPETRENIAGMQCTGENTGLNKDNTGLNNTFTFDGFVITKDNKTAYKAAQKALLHLGLCNPLYIFGGIGTGKTHLIQAIGNYYHEKFAFLKIKYINPNDFVDEYRNSLSAKTDRQFRIIYRTLDVFIIDDIQFLAGKEQSAIEFFHIFNEIVSNNKQIIFASDRIPSELHNIHERLKSRLDSSVIVELEPPCKESRKHLIIHYLKQYKIFDGISEATINYLGENIEPDIRKIIGTVKSLVIFKEIYNETITEQFCREKIKNLKNTEKSHNLVPEDIITSLEKYSNITREEIKSKKKNKQISYYRQLLMYMLKTYTDISLKEISFMLGGKTLSAVHAAVQNIENKKKADMIIDAQIHEILQYCQI